MQKICREGLLNKWDFFENQKFWFSVQIHTLNIFATITSFALIHCLITVSIIFFLPPIIKSKFTNRVEYTLSLLPKSVLLFGTKYSRMDQVKFLKAVFHKL